MFHTVIFFFLMIALSGAETITRAYYVGIVQPRNRSLAGTLLKDHKTMDVAPFQSPLFNEGDLLLNVESGWLNGWKPESRTQHAVYNQTTGYLILQGDSKTHILGRAMSSRIESDFLRSVEVSLEVFEKQEAGKEILLQTKTPSVSGMVATNTFGAAENRITLESEASSDSTSDWIDLSLTMKGRIRGRRIMFKFNLYMLDNQPLVLPLGKTSSAQEVMLLQIESQVIFDGHLTREMLVLDATAQPSAPTEILSIYGNQVFSGITDRETGKVLRAYRVPPTFVPFLTGTKPEPEADPFSSDPGQLDTIGKITRSNSWDPRLAALPTDQVFDLRQAFESVRISLKKDEFAILNQDSHTLLILTIMETMELVDGILSSTGPRTLRAIQTNLYLVEGDTKITKANLTNLEPRSSRMISSLSLPGLSASSRMGPAKLEVSASIDHGDKVVEVQYTLAKARKKADFPTMSNQLSLVSGVPTIVQSSFINGRWQAWVVTAEVIRLD